MILNKDPRKRPSPAELLANKLFEGVELKDNATDTVDNDSIQMNKVNKSIEPKSLIALKGLGANSPKI